jgi:predicted small lipoprotein YifL
MKKVFAALLLALTVVTAVGCGGGSPTKSGTTGSK